MKKQSNAVEPMVADGGSNVVAEKEKTDEKSKGGKGDPKKGKDKGDKKVCYHKIHPLQLVAFNFRVMLIYKKLPAPKK